MKTKVKPTVEKWEEKVREYLQHAFARHIQHGMDDIKKNPKWKLNNKCTDWAIGELDKAIEVVALSVQEAKAERDDEWKKIIACHNCSGTGRTDNIGGAMECIECGGQCHNLVRFDGIHIDDLLSTLNTKTSLKQEEEKI